MNALLLYAIKVVACSGILYTYYFLFLRNKLFHHYNRFYLLGAMVLSLLLPLLQIPVENDAAGEPGFVYQAVQAMDVLNVPVAATGTVMQEGNENAAGQTFSSLMTATNLLYILYTVGFLVALVLLFRSFWYIRKLSRKYVPEWIGRIRFFMTAEPGTPFSFFRSVFWNHQLPFDSPKGRQVFLHEYYHVHQKHSIDIVLAEGMLALAWFNPFFFLMKKELKAIHEFLADQYASSNNNRYDYAQLLVEQAITSRRNTLTHAFFQPQIKRRIIMIMRTHQLRYSYWSRVMALPLLAILFFMLVLRAQPLQAAAPDESAVIPAEQRIFMPERETTGPAVQPTTLPVHKPSPATIVDEEKELTLEKVRMLKRNTTSTKDLEELFGTPLTRENGDKTELWLYRGERSNLYVEVSKKESMVVHFDYQQQLLSAQLMLSFEKAEKLHQHQTTLAEVKKLFGDPNHLAINPTGEFWLYEEPNKHLEVEFLRIKGEPLKVSHHNYTESGKDGEMEKAFQTSTGKNDSLPGEVIWQYKNVRLRHPNLNPPRLHNPRIDSLIMVLIRHYNKNLRYPALETPQPPEGSVYFSVKVDGSNTLQDLILYDKAPATNGAKIHEIVVVGFAKQVNDSSNAPTFSREVIHELFSREVTRATQVPLKSAPGVEVPAPFYVRVTFKLDRDTKTVFEIKAERKKGRICILSPST